MQTSDLIQELPAGFLQRMKELLGSEYEEFLVSYEQFPLVGLRVNTLKLSPQQFLAISPFKLVPVPGLEDAFLVQGEAQPGRHPYHAAGLYYLQDPSAMVAAVLLDPQPGERVLDLSAAPGGKTTQLAAMMQGLGLLIANEIDRERVWDLVENLERFGIHNAIVTNETPSRLSRQMGGFFDRVLLDAPCSGEGMFWKSQSARLQWTPTLVESCSIRQLSILQEAARLVRPGGRLVYATCTFEHKENEGVITSFLYDHTEFNLVDIPRLPGFAPGIERWAGRIYSQMQRTKRLWPQNWPGGGQYIAVLEKNIDEQPSYPSRSRRKQPPKEALMLYETFVKDTLLPDSSDRHLGQEGNYLYQLPDELPDFGNLRVVRHGWWLGTMQKNWFEPSHALALGITSEEALRVANLDINQAEVLAYLNGEPFLSEGPNGWVLVAVNGYPLGWGKRVKNVVKNHYPKGLRWS